MHFLPPVQVMYNVLPIQFYGAEDWHNATHHPFEVYRSVEAVRAHSPESRDDRFYHSVKRLRLPRPFKGEKDYDDTEDDSLYDEFGELDQRLIPLFREAERACGLVKADRLMRDVRVDDKSWQEVFDRTASYLLEDFRVFSEDLLHGVRRLLAAEFPLWRVGLHHYPGGDIDTTEWMMVYPDGYLYERYTTHEAHAQNEAEAQCFDDRSIGGWLLPWQAALEADFQRDYGDRVRQLAHVRRALPDALARSAGGPVFIACFDRISSVDPCPIGWLLYTGKTPCAEDRFFDEDGQTFGPDRRGGSYKVSTRGQIETSWRSDPPYQLIYAPVPEDRPDVYLPVCTYDKRGNRQADEYVRVMLPEQRIAMDALA